MRDLIFDVGLGRRVAHEGRGRAIFLLPNDGLDPGLAGDGEGLIDDRTAFERGETCNQEGREGGWDSAKQAAGVFFSGESIADRGTDFK